MALSEQVVAGITEGHIVKDDGEVKISANVSPNGKETKGTYVRLLAQDAIGMAILCGGKVAPATPKPEDGKDERSAEEKAAGACDYFNYGYDLEVRAGVRADLIGTLEGPEKQIKKLFDGLVLGGWDKDEAVSMIKTQSKFKDADGLDAILKRLHTA